MTFQIAEGIYMVDFENGRKEQIQILKKQTEIKVTAPEQQKLDAF